jgi:WxL domain surface cell wall-binding
MTRSLSACAIVLIALALDLPTSAWGAGSLKFGTAPALPALPAVALNAHSQTANATMTNFSVADTTGEGKGWNVTVAGQSGTGKSVVFAQYCPEAAGCGSDAFGYVASGKSLEAKSLTLNTTGASFTGGTGSPPTLKCSTACAVDGTPAVKIASAATGGAGASTWTTTGFSATSLTLATPTTLRTLPTHEVYRVNILWTLSTGP